jgi:hypothetical protein
MSRPVKQFNVKILKQELVDSSHLLTLIGCMSESPLLPVKSSFAVTGVLVTSSTISVDVPRMEIDPKAMLLDQER